MVKAADRCREWRPASVMAKTFGTLTAPKSGPRARSKPNSAQSESRSLGGSIYASTVLSLDADGPHEEDQPLNDQQWVGSTFHVILMKFTYSIIDYFAYVGRFYKGRK